jgi:hypothetical protein
VTTTRGRLGTLCSELSRWHSLDGIIRANGAGQELDELLAAGAVPGFDPDRGRILLDAIDEACKRAGLDGFSRGAGYRPLPPGAALVAGVDSWACPFGSCDRVVLAEEATAVPLCAVGGNAALRRFLVDP